ncbi:hypothetical protein Tco_0753103 [Tanacetum coccineum]
MIPRFSIIRLCSSSYNKQSTSSREEQWKYKPNTHEAAKTTLKGLLPFKSKVHDKDGDTKRRKETKGHCWLNKGQRKGKLPMLSEETPMKSKRTNFQVEARLAEAISLDTLQKKRRPKQIHLDLSLHKELPKKEELTSNRRKESSIQLERFGEELPIKTPKILKEDKDDEAKDDESTKKSEREESQMSKKRYEYNCYVKKKKKNLEDTYKVVSIESLTRTQVLKLLLIPVPELRKQPMLYNYKINYKQGEKGVYPNVRNMERDIVYINFGAMLKSISRDDLTELYRIVMNRYGVDGPEDKLEKGFWKCLRIMFEEPLSTDSIWSEIGQQKIISWRYYDTCRVHCLNLESMDVYMLSERKYPLSAEVCKTMLKMKLLDGKMSEDCYRLLKMMEKQAGIRKFEVEGLKAKI